jgi:hypothetical protein
LKNPVFLLILVSLLAGITTLEVIAKEAKTFEWGGELKKAKA